MNKNRSQRWRTDEIKQGYNASRRFRFLMTYNTKNFGWVSQTTKNPESNQPD